MKHVLRNFLSVDLPGILFSGVPTFALRCRHFSVTHEKWILVYLRKLVILRHTCTNLVSSHFQEMNSIIEHALFPLRHSLTLWAEHGLVCWGIIFSAVPCTRQKMYSHSNRHHLRWIHKSRENIGLSDVPTQIFTELYNLFDAFYLFTIVISLSLSWFSRNTRRKSHSSSSSKFMQISI